MATTQPSVCPLDCPDTCAVNITTHDGKVLKLDGADHPITRGFACVKMARFPEKQEHADRLLYPMRRVGAKGEGKFERVSWEAALDAIAKRVGDNIARFGEQSVLPYCYAGTMGLVERDHPLAFFRGLGASELDMTICAATGSAGWEANYGPDKMSTAPEDVAYADLIVLWGINVLRSNSHLVPILKAAKKRGTRIIHIDPFRNETSKFADQHIPIAVGTDAALALCIGGEILRNQQQDQAFLDQHANDLQDYRAACAQWPIERTAQICGLTPDEVAKLAAAIGQNRATFIKAGYGLTRNEGGGNAMRAITLLPALTGAWKHRGGGAGLSTSGGFGLNTSRYSGNHLLKPDRRLVNQNRLGSTLASPTSEPPADRAAISTLFVFNSNPAAVAPNSGLVRQGLRREDLFTVVLEHFQTDTADYADYLLPATTFVEHPDIYAAYGHYFLQWAEPIVPARGECRPNSWIFQQLAARLGLHDEILSMSTQQLAAELLDSPHPHVQGLTFERLQAERSLRLNLPDNFRPYANGSNFPDKKIRFSPAPQQLVFEEQPTADFPLRLVSPPGSFFLNTSMGNIKSLIKAAGGEPSVVIHPTDAQQNSISDGQHVRLTSPTGSIIRKARVSLDAKQGVVVALGQWWPKLAPDKKGLNDLTTERLTDLGGGSTFGNVVVRVEAVAQ